MLEDSAAQSYCDAVQMIHSHARHVAIKCLLNWGLVAELLLMCRRLKTLT